MHLNKNEEDYKFCLNTQLQIEKQNSYCVKNQIIHSSSLNLVTLI